MKLLQGKTWFMDGAMIEKLVNAYLPTFNYIVDAFSKLTI